jgi:hypothetical protein
VNFADLLVFLRVFGVDFFTFLEDFFSRFGMAVEVVIGEGQRRVSRAVSFELSSYELETKLGLGSRRALRGPRRYWRVS